MKSTALLATALLALTSLRAPAEDKAGAKDHPVLKRYQDSVIFQYSQNAFAEYQLALGKALNPAAPASEGRKIEKEQTLEGKVTPATLDALSSSEYLAVHTPGWEGILKHGVYHTAKNLGVDESVMWGEYFFVEGLMKALQERT